MGERKAWLDQGFTHEMTRLGARRGPTAGIDMLHRRGGTVRMETRATFIAGQGDGSFHSAGEQMVRHWVNDTLDHDTTATVRPEHPAFTNTSLDLLQNYVQYVIFGLRKPSPIFCIPISVLA